MKKHLISLALLVSLAACLNFAFAQSLEQTKEKAEKGDAAAQCGLGVMYGKGEGVKQDWDQAKAWFEKAAAQGDHKAQRNLGMMYHRGIGVKRDYAQAKSWFEKAAAQGNAAAQFNLGYLYSQG